MHWKTRAGLSLVLVLMTVLIAPVLHAQVLINEVLYRVDPANTDPLKTQQFVELYNAGSTSADLTGWTIGGRAGRNGATARVLPAQNLAAGGYLVIHFTAGTSSPSDFYTGDTTPVFSGDMDEAGLYSPSGIIDFVSWSSAAFPYLPGFAHNDAVTAGIWTANTALNSDKVQSVPHEKPRVVELGMSIGRDPHSTDTNSPGDFEPGGGAGALDNSPGRQNADHVTVVESDPPAASARAGEKPAAITPKKWTVLLYFNGDNSLEKDEFGNVQEISLGGSRLTHQDIIGGGGSDANVNFVLQFDGKNLVTSTYRGLIVAGSNPNQMALQRLGGGSTDIGEQNMADPRTLAAFIAWAKQNYPAEHYALILSAHGDGWKYWGPDDSSVKSGHKDYLYMGETSTALAGQTFDLIGYDACLMASIEVADQLKGFTSYLVASEEEIPGYGWPYNRFANDLKANSGWSGQQLGSDIVKNYATRYAGKNDWTLSLIDAQKVTQLVQQVDTWSGLLKTGVGLFQTQDDPTDNVQKLIKYDRKTTQTFGDPNFLDLEDLASRINGDGGIPACVKTPIGQIINLINGTAVVTQVHSGDLANANGIHIYFPEFRKAKDIIQDPEDYDFPNSRQTDGDSTWAVYAMNHDQLPENARDRDSQGPLNPRLDWPEPASPGLLFVSDTHWSNFLERYYHPVADAHITKAVSDFGVVYYPTVQAGGACSNSTEAITVPIDSTVYLSATGSTDPDMPRGYKPLFYFWDLDSTRPCQVNCNLQPQSVPPGTPADQAVTNMDADQDFASTNIDQKDATGLTTTRICDTAGTFQVTLIPWDDNHLKPYHDTNPNASYVHPQSDRNQVTITCAVIDEVPTFTTNNPIPQTLVVPLSFTVSSDPYTSAAYVGLTQGTLTVTFSGIGTQPGNARNSKFHADASTTPTVAIKGDRPELPSATGTFNTTTNSFDITATATGQIAGFANVQVRYTMNFDPNFNTLSGTYEVGLNSTLNNEPQPVSYKVAGNVGSKTYPQPTGPVIVTVNTAGAGNAIAQNGWIEIHGSNLVPATTPASGVLWNDAPEFAAGHMPTKLGDVSVTVNGKAAFVFFYCSAVTSKVCPADQLNVLSPLDQTTGPVQVVVTSGGVSSPPYTVAMKATVPSYLQFNGQGYVVATHADYSLLGPADLYPGYSTPATAGETILLYGVGWGLPSTALVNGSSTQSGTLPTTPSCTIGGEPAQTVFAGLISPGLYQFNLTIPDDLADTSAVTCSYNGLTTPEGALIAIQ